jgi:hypothetical protein
LENITKNNTREEKAKMTEDISPFRALDFIRDNSEKYAIAKANVIYMTEYRKTIKAILMNESTAKTQTEKESYAYADKRYIAHLEAMRLAVEEAEKLRWLMIGAEAKIEVWRSLESTARAEGKATT